MLTTAAYMYLVLSKLLSGKPHQNIVAVNNAKSLQIVYDFDLAILRAEMQHATVGSKCSTLFLIQCNADTTYTLDDKSQGNENYV